MFSASNTGEIPLVKKRCMSTKQSVGSIALECEKRSVRQRYEQFEGEAQLACCRKICGVDAETLLDFGEPVLNGVLVNE